MRDEPELFDVEAEVEKPGVIANVWDVACWLNRVCDGMGLERLSVKRLDAHRMHGVFMQRGITGEAELRDALTQYLQHGAPKVDNMDLFEETNHA